MTSIHHHNHHHHLTKSTPASAAASSTTQACAACKYQRRKCAPDCILAPFFPHDRQRQFLNAHKLFGVSNITKIIKNLEPLQKEQAMSTIIFQSDVRASDPVGGCYRIVENLQRQIAYTKAELQIVEHHLAICKQQAAAAAAAAAILEPDPVSHGFEGIEHQFVDHQGFDEDQDVELWGIQDSEMNSSSSSLNLKQSAAAVSVIDFYDSDHRLHHHHQQQLLKFHDHQHLLHHSEEAMLKMENVMLKEDNGPIQQAEDEDEDLKGAVDSLLTFPTNTT